MARVEVAGVDDGAPGPTRGIDGQVWVDGGGELPDLACRRGRSSCGGRGPLPLRDPQARVVNGDAIHSREKLQIVNSIYYGS